MLRTVLMALLCLSAPTTVLADDDESSEELDFLDNDKAEEKRKAREADRAPAGDVFLDEEDEESPEMMTIEQGGAQGAGELLDEDDEDLEGPLLQSEEDAEEDEDGDPVDDLSPADRASLMKPLANNYPLALVQRTRSKITVELPVLVAQDAGDFGGEDYWVVAQMVVNGTQISEGRHLVTKSGIASFGPTKVWFKLEAPIDGPEADVEVRISQRTSKSSRSKALFSRSLTIGM